MLNFAPSRSGCLISADIQSGEVLHTEPNLEDQIKDIFPEQVIDLRFALT